MGLLKNGKEKTLTYEESKKYQRFLKKVSALQLTKLFKLYLSFQNTEQNRLKFGIEQEFHLITDFEYVRKSEQVDSKKMQNIAKMTTEREFSVCIDRDRFVESIPKDFNQFLEFMPEYSAWMLEIVPKRPFSHFLNAKEIKSHLRVVDSLNEASSQIKQMGGKKRQLVLSSTIFPKVGYADYFIRPNGERIPYAERKEINKFSGSNYFIDETISDHVRFPTLTQNSVLKRGAPVEINVPIFVDFKTKIRFNVYEDAQDYGNVPFVLEEKLRKKLEQSVPGQVKRKSSLIGRNWTPFSKTTEHSFHRKSPSRI